MSRQWIARAVIAGLVMNAVPAWAQDPVSVQNKVAGCEKPSGLETAYWNSLMPWQQEERCAYKWQASVEKRHLSEKLMGVGVVTTIVGLASMVNWGKTVDVLGSDYCVDDYSVTAGGCSTSATQKKIGGMIALAGVSMIVIGNTKVTVTNKSVTATIAWGGR